jgi:predicted RNA-binding protein YlqC (UPF0109 family)
MSAMKELVEYIAKSITTDTEAVEETEYESRHSVSYRLLVAQHDMGRVIGKHGQMANAMRTLLRVAAVKAGKRVSLEIGE